MRQRVSFPTAAAIVWALVVLAYSSSSRASVPLISGFGGPMGFGTSCLSPNDDGSSDPIDIRSAFPAGLRFFSGTYTSAYVNTNGNITFNGALPTYTPSAFPVADQPMIAPYWADVDIRPPATDCGGYLDASGSPGNGPCQNPSSNGVWWTLSPGRMIVTWHRVGYFRCHQEKLMSFQMVLADASDCGTTGDFDVEFRYNLCDWTTGDASGGMGGFGGTPAQAGFDAGDSMNFFSIPGSLSAGINTLLCTTSNTGLGGLWHFQIRSGTVQTDGGTQSCGIGSCVRVTPVCDMGHSVVCVPGNPINEVCNGLDDNCNGTIDEGETSCGVGACLRTVPLCTNGLPTVCRPGQPQPEMCNGIDDNCNGVVDETCNDASIPLDASTPVDASRDCAADGRCTRVILLEGRAGPLGNCTCRAAGGTRTGGRSLTLGAAMFALAGWTLRTRRRRRAQPNQ